MVHLKMTQLKREIMKNPSTSSKISFKIWIFQGGQPMKRKLFKMTVLAFRMEKIIDFFSTNSIIGFFQPIPFQDLYEL